MDVDWCLSCERKLVRPILSLQCPPHSNLAQDDLGPYCSPECLSYAQPSSSLCAHPCPLPSSGTYRIRQWAQAIPPHIPAGAPTLPFADLPPASPSLLSAERPPSPRARHQPTPKLIERTAASTPLPTLCISSPAHVRPPHPARAPSHSYSRPNTTSCMSEASTSLSSLLTEPMIATPDEDLSFGANIGAFVRSWVNCDRVKNAKEDYVPVIEKVTDYFPPLPPQQKKPSSSPSSSKKSKKTPPQSPAPAFRRKQSVKKVAPALDKYRPTSAHSHTPTPVIFPSCRAAELYWVGGQDEDEDEDEQQMVVAPRAQYHPAYYQKYEPQREIDLVHWTRAPSLSSSVSSTNSSVLLMAPKCRDATGGSRSTRMIAA